MALRKTMPARDPQSATPDNPHSREYAASRGGYAQAGPKPVPGTPKEK